MSRTRARGTLHVRWRVQVVVDMVKAVTSSLMWTRKDFQWSVRGVRWLRGVGVGVGVGVKIRSGSGLGPWCEVARATIESMKGSRE